MRIAISINEPLRDSGLSLRFAVSVNYDLHSSVTIERAADGTLLLRLPKHLLPPNWSHFSSLAVATSDVKP